MTISPSTVHLVDDHALIREGLRRALERDGSFVVIGESGSLAEARAIIRRRPPEALVVDLRLPDGNGLELVREIVPDMPRLAVVVVSMYAGDGELLASRDAGASAFVAKDAPASAVRTALVTALADPRVFVAEGLEGAIQRQAHSPVPRLTQRELEVLRLLADGQGIAGISRGLFISQSTTKTHVSNIYDKLGAANRAQAIMSAIRLGVIPAPDLRD